MSADHEALGVTYLEAHVATPVDECARRDVKGLYAAAARGEVTTLTGVSDPYEPPVAPDIRLDTTDQELTESVSALRTLLTDKGLR